MSVCRIYVSRRGESFSIITDACDSDLAETARVSCGYAKIGNAYMHRIIAKRMGLGGDCVDHADGNTLNNSRRNLRAASRFINSRNRAASGVCAMPSGMFFAKITVSTPARYAGDPGHESDRAAMSFAKSVRQVERCGKWRLVTTVFGGARDSVAEAYADYVKLKHIYHGGIVGRRL